MSNSSTSSSSSSYTSSEYSGDEDSDSVVTLDDSEADSDMLKGPLLEVVKKRDGKGGKERRVTATKAAPSELDAGGDSDEEQREELAQESSGVHQPRVKR